VVLVIVVSLIGFWEWGSALLMATSIPVTLARTLGFMQLLFLDIQQMSIALLIIALGLLVDDLVGGRWRAQAGTGAGQEPLGGSLARAGQALEGDPQRYHHQCRCLADVPPNEGRRQELHLQHAGDYRLFAGRLAPDFDDLHSAPGVLSAAGEGGAGRHPSAVLQPRCRFRD